MALCPRNTKAELWGKRLWRPFQVELALGNRTVHEVQIDKALVRNVGFLGHSFEIFNYIRAHPESNLLLKPLGIRVWSGLHLR